MSKKDPIYKKLNNILKLIKPCLVNSENEPDCLYCIPKEMRKLGFRFVYKPESSSVGIFISRKLGVVVKSNYICGNTPKKYCVPTLHYHNVLIQPICNPIKDPKKLYKFVNYFTDKLYFDKFVDIHEGNVMYYKRKPVLIDW